MLLVALACTTPKADPDAPCVGLDTDGDGVCDRERADWSEGSELPAGGDRHNVYDLDPDALAEVRAEGLEAALRWPVAVTGVLLPADAVDRALAEPGMAGLARVALGYTSVAELQAWIGLPPWREDTGIYAVERPPGAADRMGAAYVDTPHGTALTLSCATCHAADFFGRTVLGLTNRQTRANEFLVGTSAFFPGLDPEIFREVSAADEDEMAIFLATQEALGRVGAAQPQVRGLDTSLAQVGLSLAKRADDAWATPDPEAQRAPRPNLLDDHVADSKPAVWWTLRYKTRWLSDGSIVSGNPIHTNLLWNEIGRGTDLRALDTWLATEDALRAVDALTVAVFATEAPRWTDFFPDAGGDVAGGHAIYEAACAGCHGSYRADGTLDYPRRTVVHDVGTDPGRAEGMAGFADALNGLAISADLGTLVEVQQGYVAPPLDGIFARYPYLHNGSVPTLCALLSPPEERPTEFWMGPSVDPATDYDIDCVGYPTGDAVPEAWKAEPGLRFDATRPGLSNQGHVVDLDDAERAAVIAFLRTR